MARQLRDSPAVQVRGGGISADGTTATVVLHGARGTFDDGTPWEVDHGSVLTPNTAGATATYPNAAADMLYRAYVVKPRFPAGYDAALAAREFVPGSAALTAIGGGVADGIRGCFAIVTPTSVNTIPDAETAAGAPASRLTLAALLSGLPGQFTPASDAIYLREVRARPERRPGVPSAHLRRRRPGPQGVGRGRRRLRHVEQLGDREPVDQWGRHRHDAAATAQVMHVHMTGLTSGSGSPNARIQSPSDPSMGVQFGAVSAAQGTITGLQGDVRVDSSGDADVTLSGTWTTDPEAAPFGYLDSCLARRAA